MSTTICKKGSSFLYWWRKLETKIICRKGDYFSLDIFKEENK